MARIAKLFGLLGLLWALAGCQGLLHGEHVPQPVKKPAIHAKKETAPVVKKSDPKDAWSDLLEHLYYAQMELSAYNRTEAEQHIKAATEIAGRLPENVTMTTPVMIEIVYQRKGFLMPVYVPLGIDEKLSSLEGMLKRLSGQGFKPAKTYRLLKIRQDKPAKNVATSLQAAAKALGRIDIDTPTASFAQAQKEVQVIYDQLAFDPYKAANRLMLEKNLMLAGVFFRAGYYDVSREAVKQAEEYWQAHEGEFLNGAKKPTYLATYQNEILTLKRALKTKNPNPLKNVGMLLDGGLFSSL